MTNDTTAATKADIRRLQAEIRGLDAAMREMSRGLHEAIDQVLIVMSNIDKRLTQTLAQHEKRITRLETYVGMTP